MLKPSFFFMFAFEWSVTCPVSGTIPLSPNRILPGTIAAGCLPV